jgi:hypothetical protein
MVLFCWFQVVQDPTDVGHAKTEFPVVLQPGPVPDGRRGHDPLQGPVLHAPVYALYTNQKGIEGIIICVYVCVCVCIIYRCHCELL